MNEGTLPAMTLSELMALTENVVQDYADKCCDDLVTCDCSMARLSRSVQAT